MRRLRYLLVAISIGLSLVYGWFGRTVLHDIDGISYLDMGDAYLWGDWKTGFNGLWSPLYGVLVGSVLKIVRPSASWEFPLVHLTGFVIYIVALLCFDFFWNELGQILHERSDPAQGSWMSFPQWAWLLLGYCLFLWVSLQLITVLEETPDMLLSAAIYLASAFLVRISRDRAGLGTFILLGLVLGLGYLTKAILFPLSFVFLAVAAFTAYRRRQSFIGPLLAVLMFFLIASPLIVALSRAKGRVTFGDSGKINYLWHVDGVPRMYWQGNYPGSGAPIHPPRLILDKPPIYEFGTPFAVTFPPWYDPSYWYEGMKPHFDLGKQIRAFIEAVGIYHGLFVKPGAALIAVSLILLLLGRSVKELVGRLDLLLPAVSAFGLYALLHVEPRYVGCFILVFWGGVLCQVRLPKSDFASRLLRLSTVAIVVIYCAELCIGAFTAITTERGLANQMESELQVVQGLTQAGLQPGDPVATIGGISGMVWGRLAKVRVVACSPDDTDSWLQAPDTRSKALAVFASTGAKIIVAAKAPPTESADGWKRIGQSEYYLYGLQRPPTFSDKSH